MRPLILGSLFLVLGFIFQNCSKVNVSDLKKVETLKTNAVFDTPVQPLAAPEERTPAEEDTESASPISITPTATNPTTSLRFLLSCPDDEATNVDDDDARASTSKSLSALSTTELKVVLMQKQPTGNVVICEIKNVRQQLFSKARSVDISKCAPINTRLGFVSVYLVDENVTSQFEEKKYNNGMNLYRGGISGQVLPYSVPFAEFGDPKYRDPKFNITCNGLGDPLLVQLNGGKAKSIELSAAKDGVMFDLLGKKNNHTKVATAWFTNSKSDNYFVVLPDKNGSVLGINELFGDNTVGPDGKFSKMGFEALAKYDSDHDKKIDIKDDVYQKLFLWKDNNLDGIAQQQELHSLSAMKVKTIDLRYDKNYMEQDQHGNIVKYKSVIIMNDGSYGLVYDLWLRYIMQ